MADTTLVLKLKVNDKGELVGLGKKAEKTGKKVEKLNTNVQATDRVFKGASRQSSNTTKNFSKMQQGIQGGLVPAYATLAASLFALGAVFRALQEAADFAALTTAQQVFAAETGVALSSVSAKLQEATGNQIDLQKAGQSAAIMIAKGFNVDQIEQVAKASTNAAQALGRNFEDTFNRIVQGTTKAEPELLDELGITLRLEKATRDFAQAVGKNREELTAFERSQAVLNETLRQAEENFGAIDGAVPINTFNQLGTLFSDLAKQVGLFIQPLSNFLGAVLVNNVGAAAAAMGLFATSILSAVIPGIEEIGTGMQESMAQHEQASKKALKNVKKLTQQQQKLRQSIEETRAAGAKGVAAISQKVGGDSPVLARAAVGEMRGADSANLNKALRSAEAQYAKHGKIVTGIFKGKDIKIVKSLRNSFNQMNTQTQTFAQKTGVFVKQVELQFKVMGTRIKSAWSATMAGMTRAGQGFVTGMNKLLSAAGFIGIIVLLFNTMKSIVFNLDNIIRGAVNGIAGLFDFIADNMPSILGDGEMFRGASSSLRSFSEDFKIDFVENLREGEEISQRFSDSLENINSVIKDLKGQDTGDIPEGALKRAQFIGNRVSTSNVLALVTRAQSAARQFGADDPRVKEQANAVQEIIDELAKTSPEITTFGNVLEIDTDKLSAFVLGLQSGGQALRDLKNEQEGVNRRRAEFSKQFQGGVFGKELASVQLALNALQGLEGKLTDSDKGVLSDILGVDVTADNIAGVRTQISGIITELEQLIQNQRDLESRKLGLENESAGLQFRKDALAVLEKEGIKKRQLALAEDVQRQKIAEFQRNMEGLKGTERINAEANLRILHQQLVVLEAQTEAYKESTLTAFKLQQTFAQGIEKMFLDIAMGTSNAKEAFASLAKSILAEMAKIAAARMAANIMSFIPFAQGGIIPMASGGIINTANSYSRGGIATEPTYLVGEGKHNEAVVPLPNGRSIPVEMNGSGSTNVTINVDGSSTASGGIDAETGKQLGTMIQAATMEIIQREKRPGGVLSR
tara:strand:- start:8344 stop:11433 length:3090 start_codon:yes stop_codon:yes gene_type:complete